MELVIGFWTLYGAGALICFPYAIHVKNTNKFSS